MTTFNGPTSVSRRGKKDTKEILKEQEIIQAVFIADSFSDKLAPLTDEKPTVLLPVVNRILLEYVLEALEQCGIQETFLFCHHLSAQIKQYVSSSKWGSSSSSMTVTVVVSNSIISTGDVLREVDSRNLIRSDFILLSGNVLTTLPLLEILEEHKMRKPRDKGCAMTVIYRKALPMHKTRSAEDNYVLALDSSNKIRHYHKVTDGKPVIVPLEVFHENNEVAIRHDLLNCHISVCSPVIPTLYTDNFDFQTQDDLVRGLLINEDILNYSIYVHIAQSGYGACISNLYMYDVVSQDIIRRWTYPIVPDLFSANGSQFLHLKHNIYKQDEVDFGRGCCIEQNVVIGKGSKIGDNTVIKNSVIGQNCHIGNNVKIIGSYLWDNVKVGNDCCLDTCLLANDVVLKESAAISPGCILSYKVVIGSGVQLPRFVKLRSEPFCGDSDFEGDDLLTKEHAGGLPIVCDSELVGSDGKGFLYLPSNTEEDDEVEGQVQDVWGAFEHLQLEDEDVEGNDGDDHSSATSVTSEHLHSGSDSPVQDYEALLFYNEVYESIKRAIEEKVSCDNLVLEISSSKFTYNVSIKEVNMLVTKAILKLPEKKENEEMTSNEYFAQLKPALTFFIPLLAKYIKNPSSQMDCIISLEEFFVCNEELSPAMVKAMHFLYENEILSEASLLKWYDSPLASNSAKQNKVRKQTNSFIRWLREADEESSED